MVLPIVDSLQLPPAAAGGFSLFDPLHLALADVEPVSLHRGEHVSLEVLLEPPDCSFELAAWVTASQYHLLHSVVLLTLGLFAAYSGRSIRWPASLFCAGILLFSGSIYVLALTKLRWLGPVTPVGGLLLILGWLSLVRVGQD